MILFQMWRQAETWKDFKLLNYTRLLWTRNLDSVDLCWVEINCPIEKIL